MKRVGKCNRGFTLVELLVVIGIIALLISMLLPALNRVRRAANTLKCAANIRSILQAVQIYATQNKGAIPGSAWTTGQMIFSPPGRIDTGVVNPTYRTGPMPTDVLTATDWMTPIARIMNYRLVESKDVPKSVAEGDSYMQVARFEQLRRLPIFACPQNEQVAAGFPGSGGVSAGIPVGPNTSYIAAAAFLIKRNTGGSTTNLELFGASYLNPPSTYKPQISAVGNAARKIFIADGAKYSYGGHPPDININFDTTINGSQFTDQGPHSVYTTTYDRSRAPTNTSGAYHSSLVGPDPRLYAYRHGTEKSNGPADAYKMNCGFFDGHVELLGDLESADPKMWTPRGTDLTIDWNSAENWNDVVRRYFGGQPIADYIVPW